MTKGSTTVDIVTCLALAGMMAFWSVAARAQTIAANPSLLAFSASACANDPQAQTVSITNTGKGTLSWQLANPLPPGFSITPAAGSAPETITIKPPAGLPVGVHRFTLIVNSNDPATPAVKIEMVVVIRPCAPPSSNVVEAVYEVELQAEGFAGEFSTLPDCKVNTRGFDRLTGIVYGYEPSTPDDDVIYDGVLLRITIVDYCLTKGRRGPSDDERVYCTVSLLGTDLTDIELTVHGDSARGAWMKAATFNGQMTPFRGPNRLSTPTVSLAHRFVTGNCDAQETNDVKNGYPNADDGGGLSPNGQAIDDLSGTDSVGKPITFFRNRVARLRVGTYPPDKRNGTGNGWTLVVVRKIR